MYILINTSDMIVMHKHDDPFKLASVACVECPDEFSIIPILDAVCLKGFTDMELKALMRNTTRNELDGNNRLRFIRLVWLMCCDLPVSRISTYEADLQASYVRANKGEFNYVYGAKIPARRKQPTLFNHTSPSEGDLALPAVTKCLEPVACPVSFKISPQEPEKQSKPKKQHVPAKINENIIVTKWR